MNRRVLIIFGFVILLLNLWFGKKYWFYDLEKQASIGRDAVYSEPLDLSRTGTYTWAVPKAGWSFREGESKLSLLIANKAGLPEDRKSRSTLPLRIKVSAQGKGDHGEVFDRLVRNWYYTTDKPFDDAAKLWLSIGGSEIEYGLAGVCIYPFESTLVTIDVDAPDAKLSNGNTRLKLVGNYDYAVNEALPFLRAFKEVCFIVSIVMLVAISYLAWIRRV